MRMRLAAWLAVALLSAASASEAADVCSAGPYGCKFEIANLKEDSVEMLQTRLSVSQPDAAAKAPDAPATAPDAPAKAPDAPAKENGAAAPAGGDVPTPAQIAPTASPPADEPEFKVTRGQVFLVLFFVLGGFAVVLIAAQKLKTLPCCRSIPFAAVTAFALFLVGEGLANVYFTALREGLVSMKVEDVDNIMMHVRLSFATLLIVNTVALSLSFLGAGCFREHIFGARSEAHPWLISCGQCLIGPLLLMVLEILVWLTLVLQLLLSYVFLMAALLVVGMGFFCDKLAADLAPVQKVLDAANLGWSMSSFCGGVHHHGYGGLFLFAGCAVTVISQVAMLMALAGEKARIEAELEKIVPGAVSSPGATN